MGPIPKNRLVVQLKIFFLQKKTFFPKWFPQRCEDVKTNVCHMIFQKFDNIILYNLNAQLTLYWEPMRVSNFNTSIL
jgi:hypothetical protein